MRIGGVEYLDKVMGREIAGGDGMQAIGTRTP